MTLIALIVFSVWLMFRARKTENHGLAVVADRILNRALIVLVIIALFALIPLCMAIGQGGLAAGAESALAMCNSIELECVEHAYELGKARSLAESAVAVLWVLLII